MGVGVSLMRFKYPANQGNCDAIVIVETRFYQIMFSNKMHIFQFKKHEKLNLLDKSSHDVSSFRCLMCIKSSNEQSTFIGKFTFVYKLLVSPLNEFLQPEIM